MKPHVITIGNGLTRLGLDIFAGSSVGSLRPDSS